MDNACGIGICLLCGTPLPKPLFYARDSLYPGPETYPVIKCNTCSLFITARSSDFPSLMYPPEYHKRIIAERKGKDAKLPRSYDERLKSIREISEHGTLLDVGCGDGSLLMALRAAGWKVCGTELNKDLVNRLRCKGLDVRTGKLIEVAFPDDHFDVITYYGSFEHIDDPLLELDEIRRIMKPNGWLLISATNAGSLEARLFGSKWFGFEVPRHRFNYTPASLRRLIVRSGLHCRKITRRQNSGTTCCSLQSLMGAQRTGLRLVCDLLSIPLTAVALLSGQGNVVEILASPVEDLEYRL